MPEEVQFPRIEKSTEKEEVPHQNIERNIVSEKNLLEDLEVEAGVSEEAVAENQLQHLPNAWESSVCTIERPNVI